MEQDDGRANRVEPQTLAFLQAVEEGGAPLQILAPAAARSRLAAIQRNVQITKAPVTIEERVINSGPTGQLKLWLVRPSGNTGRPLPGILYLHGGWVVGNQETHDRLVRELVNGTQSMLIFVAYDQAPEARYPVAIEQAYQAMLWVAEQGAAIGVDPSRLAVVGDGVGGTLAAVMTLLAKQRQGPQLLFQLLFYPVTAAEFGTDSYRQFGDR